MSDAQRSVVIEEVNRILVHPVFKNSDRCVALLRYLINLALASGDVEIKERTIGIEVFGRFADYDVSTDPIVRRYASDIRKRLAQYYQECGDRYSVKIDLVRGSYLPEFEFAPRNGRLRPAEELYLEDSLEQLMLREQLNTPLEIPSPAKTLILRRSWVLALVALIVAGLAVLAWLQVRAFYSPIYRVWEPFLDSGDTITVCLPVRGTSMKAAGQSDAIVNTTFRDVIAGSNITELLSNYKKHPSLRPAIDVKFRDFHDSPTVLIGGVNNPWVPTLLYNLRYSIHYDPVTNDSWIQDAQAPNKRDWKIDGKSAAGDPPADYALITRAYDQKTNQWVMALSGLAAKGTEGASRFVSDPQYSKLLPTGIRKDQNFQIVLRVGVINGEPGPLQVLAVQMG